MNTSPSEQKLGTPSPRFADVAAAWAAEASDTATAEQQRLLGRPEVGEGGRRLTMKVAALMDDALERPQLFEARARTAVRRLRRARKIPSPHLRQREVDRIIGEHLGPRRRGRAARIGTNARQRGSRRGASSRSCARSSDSGDPDESDPGDHAGADPHHLHVEADLGVVVG